MPESAEFLHAPGQRSVLQVLGRAWCFVLQLSLLARGVGSAEEIVLGLKTEMEAGSWCFLVPRAGQNRMVKNRSCGDSLELGMIWKTVRR